MRYQLILIAGLLFASSCKPKTVPVQADAWTELTIDSENNTEITILHENDTVTVKFYHKGDLYARPKKVTVDTPMFLFSKQERDSVFSLVQEIIASPPIIKHYCTDFVGDLTLKIYYDQRCTRTIDYSGVCNWNILSDKTLALHAILKRRMPKVFLGEDDGSRSHAGN